MDLDSDLEEGEIVDSPPPSPQMLNINKRKELPQRYVEKDSKTPLHKHKKSCKHSSRHHAKKPPKMKKSPIKKKSSPRFHHKPSCTYEKSNRVLGRHNSSNTSKHTFPKNGFHPQSSLIPEMKDSFKHAPPFKKQSKNFDKPKSQHTSFVEENFKTSKKDFAISEISSAKKYENEVDGFVAGNISTNFELSENTDSFLELSKNSDDISIIELDVCEPSPPPLIDLIDSPDSKSPTPKLNSGTDINDVSNANSNNPQVKDEESEDDEEELRRIALATFAKRKLLQEPENLAQNTIQHCEENGQSNNVQNPHEVINSQAADNYEVVDMDLDDDDDDGMQNLLETAQISVTNEPLESTENLFIIDTHPSCDFMHNRKKSDSQADNSDDEDFQANILRAELINSMYRKKLLHEGSKQSDIVSHEKRMPIVNQKKFLLNYHRQKLQFSYKRLKSAKHFLRKRTINKFVNIKNIDNYTNKTPLPVPANKPIERPTIPVPANKPIEKCIIPVPTNKPVERLIMPVPSNKPIERPIMPVPSNKPTERLIITVNGESSDDSDEDETNPASENPLDSISALISDCRQKSESNEKTEEIVPKAVECLSKAQQEEYNSLKRILATKTKLPSTKVTLSTKNGSVHSPLDDLKKLEKKLVVLRGDLQNKKESMSTLSEEVNTKKLHYMKAKLTAQHLKEQLVAAEKIRKVKLLDWSKTCENLKLMRQSVSDLESKMNEVQSLCSKLGSSLQGQSYKLPLLSSCNGQL